MAATRCFPKILYNVFKKLQTGNCVKVSSASSPEYFFFYKLSLMTSSNISRFGISWLAQFLLCCVTDPWCCKSSFPFRRAFFQSLYHVSRKGDFSFPCVCVCVCVCVFVYCMFVCVFMSIHREIFICLDQRECHGTDQQCYVEVALFLTKSLHRYFRMK